MELPVTVVHHPGGGSSDRPSLCVGDHVMLYIFLRQSATQIHEDYIQSRQWIY